MSRPNLQNQRKDNPDEILNRKLYSLLLGGALILRFLFLLMLAHLLFTLRPWAGEASLDDEIAKERIVESTYEYEVRFEGVENDDLLETLRGISKTEQLKDRPPLTLQLLENRVKDDLDLLVRALKAEGYFGGEVQYDIQEEAHPIQVVFRVLPGPTYRLAAVNIDFVNAEAAESVVLPATEELGFVLNETITTETIVDAQNTILSRLRRQGFPFPKIAERKVVVDHGTQSVRVTYLIDTGRVGAFGPTTIQGLTSVHESFVRNRIEWQDGELFNAEYIVETQRNLIKSDLFALARITQAESVNEEGQVPMTITLEERKHRTVGVGLEYQTNEGPGGSLLWEHRNLFGGGERLTTEAMASGIEYSGDVLFRKPDFLVPDQALLAELRVGYDHPEPYTSRNITLSLLLEREFNEDMTLRGGIEYRLANIEQLDMTQDFGLFSLPVQFEWDHSNDLFNPTEGGRLTMNLEPAVDTFGSGVMFVKGYARYSHYIPFGEDPRFVLAGQLGVGSILGSSLLDLPADERFYAGGGGSIRGYRYQTVSPLIDDHPIGGKSVLEMSVELRMRITKTIGLVGFVDGGNAFDATYPDFSDPLQWGTGVGLRYYTGIGPIRFDVAFPLNRRSGDLDDPFQIYVSLGQAY